MGRSKPAEETIEKVIAAVLEEARKNKTLADALVIKMREADPGTVLKLLDTLIEETAASLPEDKRQKFLEELLAVVRPG
jgi:hypothetical protein